MGWACSAAKPIDPLYFTDNYGNKKFDELIIANKNEIKSRDLKIKQNLSQYNVTETSNR